MTIRNNIEGIFRLTTPMHCAAGSVKRDGKNLNLTMSMDIFLADGQQYIPYFPGNDIRGRVRRFAAKRVLDHICATSKVKQGLYSGLLSGSDSAQPDGSALTVEEIMRARENIFMGVFGGGARILRSRWKTGDIIPVIQDTIEANMVPAHFGERTDTTFLPMVWKDNVKVPARGYELIHEYNLTRVDDVYRVLNPVDIMNYVEDAVNAVTNYQNSTVENKDARQADTTGATKKKDVGNMMSFQAIAAGVPMYSIIDFEDDLGDAQVGLICMAVRDFCNAQEMGGLVSKRLGRFTADLKLTRNDRKTPLLRMTDAGVYELAGEAAEYAECVQEGLSKVTAEKLTEFYLPRKKKAKK